MGTPYAMDTRARARVASRRNTLPTNKHKTYIATIPFGISFVCVCAMSPLPLWPCCQWFSIETNSFQIFVCILRFFSLSHSGFRRFYLIFIHFWFGSFHNWAASSWSTSKMSWAQILPHADFARDSFFVAVVSASHWAKTFSVWLNIRSVYLKLENAFSESFQSESSWCEFFATAHASCLFEPSLVFSQSQFSGKIELTRDKSCLYSRTRYTDREFNKLAYNVL